MVDSNRINFPAYAFWSYAISIALLPIGLGGDRAVPLGLAQAGLSLSCLFIAFSPDIWRQAYFFKRLRWALGLLLIVFAWTLFQIQPWVPESWMHPLWREAAPVLGKHMYGSISIVPEDGLKGITRLFTYIVSGFLAYILAQNAKRAQQIVWTIWVSGSIICLYGLVLQALGFHKILWFDKWAYVDDLTATFVNRNHFAIYAGMILVCGVSLLIQSWRKKAPEKDPRRQAEVIRNWLKHGVPQAIVLVLILFCILLSDSRAGLMFSLIGLGTYLFFFQIYLRAWIRALVVGVIVFFILIAIAALAVETSDHFATLFDDYSSFSRSQVYALTWHAVRDNIWLGYGMNGFEPEFRLYQQGIVEEFNHVHSDILESILDLGLPVALLLWGAIGLMLSGLWHGIRRRRQNGMFPAIGLAASLMVLGHALVDFDLQIPGVTMTWAALLGTGLAQSWGQSERRSEGGA